jgi:hypothetical protein
MAHTLTNYATPSPHSSWCFISSPCYGARPPSIVLSVVCLSTFSAFASRFTLPCLCLLVITFISSLPLWRLRHSLCLPFWKFCAVLLIDAPFPDFQHGDSRRSFVETCDNWVNLHLWSQGSWFVREVLFWEQGRDGSMPGIGISQRKPHMSSQLSMVYWTYPPLTVFMKIFLFHWIFLYPHYWEPDS